MRPSTSEADTIRRLNLTTEAIRILEENSPALGALTDTTDILESLRIEGTVLDIPGILALKANQDAVAGMKSSLREMGERTPLTAEMCAPLEVFGDWEKWVAGSFDDKGEMLDSASPGLKEARREQARARQEATRRLEEFTRREGVAKVLQENYITLRNGRFVLPARTEYHRAFEGVVQDSSQSGQTLFVEPSFAVELNNRHTTAGNRVREEEHKVLAQMSLQAAGFRGEMARNLTILAGCDLVLAKARFGKRIDGVIPAIDMTGTGLVAARHPLLVLDPEVECVPVNVEMGEGVSTLVITGPNTGGKTAALKTMGLLTLMAQSGVPVPADGLTRIRVFENVFADIGDEQSLAQSLSTFSAHISVITGILETADENTLVLLDELGAGTDPQEGSALGVALLEELDRKGASVVVTTHHNLLKEFAYRWERASNASTMFDPDTLTPTYQLKMGTPGRSHALQIAGRLNLDETVVSRAREIMGSGAARVDELLGRLSEEVDREASARQETERLRNELAEERERLRRSHQKLREETGNIKEKARQEAASLIRELERRGKKVIKDMGKQPVESARSELKASVNSFRKKVAEKIPLPPRRKSSGKVTAGQEAEVISLGVNGTVQEISGQEAVVLAGGIRMKVPLADLEPLVQVARPAQKKQYAASVSYHGEMNAPSEVNLLGQTVDEALAEVDKVLDRSVMGPGSMLRIVHGKGTGALKRAIGEALKSDPRVASFGPGTLEEGGAGVTVVKLKE
jgi:DNA mismatch repair protein MutS2